MAIPKKRKLDTNRRPRKRTPVEKRPPFESTKFGVRIKPNVLNKLRDDEDFIALLRAARIHNVLNYMMGLVGEGKDDTTPAGRRAVRREFMNMGGYLYESLRVIESIYSKYHNEWFCSQISEIYNDTDRPRFTKILKTVRDGAAFHIDKDNSSTRKALAMINLPYYDFVSAEDSSLASLYFDLIDTLDLNFVVDELKGDRSEPEVVEEMNRTLASCLRRFSFATNQFVNGISVKLKLIDAPRSAAGEEPSQK